MSLGAGFLGLERLCYGPWQAFERALQRLLIHAGMTEVRLVGGSGDGGADLVAQRGSQTWIVQAKHRTTGQRIAADAVQEVVSAASKYGADVAVVATNAQFSQEAVAFAKRQKSALGIDIRLWDHDKLTAQMERLGDAAEARSELRDYQLEAFARVQAAIAEGRKRGALYMATGLGKTRVAAAVIEEWLHQRPASQVLVLVPTVELVTQIEAALWPYLPKQVPTHILTGNEKPSFEGGVVVSTYHSAVRRTDFVGRFGLVIVDEAHHAPAEGLRGFLSELAPYFLLGLTATPWRGDQRSLAALFGEPLYAIGLVEGMQRGYLATVDYRMLLDNIEWTRIQEGLREGLTINELNRRLFVPELDDAVVRKIAEHVAATPSPRAVVFTRSIEHARRVHRLLQAEGLSVAAMHGDQDRIETTLALRAFRAGAADVLVVVDMLNEGVDVPEVNLIVFLRVTHSRRIFVQQLGRGLRLGAGKASVRVVDFVSDIRRIAAAIAINREAGGHAAEARGATVVYPAGHVVKFEGDVPALFTERFLADAADLEDEEEDARLAFPGSEFGGVE